MVGPDLGPGRRRLATRVWAFGEMPMREEAVRLLLEATVGLASRDEIISTTRRR